MTAHVRVDMTRFPPAVDAALREAGWYPGRRDMRETEVWADTLREHRAAGGHEHVLFPAAVEAWAEFGGLLVLPGGPGRDIAPSGVHVDPLHGLHAARTLADLGRALGTSVAPLGTEVPPGCDDPDESSGLLAVDAEGRLYCLDHTGDWFLGADVDAGLTSLLTGRLPTRLVPSG